jgi:hypothetical protein
VPLSSGRRRLVESARNQVVEELSWELKRRAQMVVSDAPLLLLGTDAEAQTVSGHLSSCRAW